MANTPNLNMPEIAENQSSKYVTHNEALTILDALVQCSMIDMTTTPPGSPNDGDCYIVTSVATGDWAGQEDDIAYYDGSSWDFNTPEEGWRAWVRDENVMYVFDGSNWVIMEGLGKIGLLGTLVADAQDTSKQTIYTVPTGFSMIPHMVVFRTPSASLAGLVDLDIGGDAGASDWIQQVSLNAFTATTDYGTVLQPEQAAGPPIVPTKKTVYAAAVEFGIKINTGSTGAANVTVDLFGYLY